MFFGLSRLYKYMIPLRQTAKLWFGEPDTEPDWLVRMVWHDKLCRYVLTPCSLSPASVVVRCTHQILGNVGSPSFCAAGGNSNSSRGVSASANTRERKDDERTRRHWIAACCDISVFLRNDGLQMTKSDWLFLAAT